MVAHSKSWTCFF